MSHPARDPVTSLLSLVLALACSGPTETPSGADVPGEGTVRITLSLLDQNSPTGGSYAVRLGDSPSTIALSPGEPLSQRLESGPQTVALLSPDPGCADEAGNNRIVQVPADGTADVAFAVSCAGRFGSLKVVVQTIGQDIDPDGFHLTVSAVGEFAVGMGDTLMVDGLLPGARTISGIRGLAPNCSAYDAFTGKVLLDPHLVPTVSAGHATTITLSIACHPVYRDRIFLKRFLAPGLVAGLSLWAVRTDGSDPFALPISMIYPGDFDISPDGSRVAYVLSRNGPTPRPEPQLRIAYLDGTTIAESVEGIEQLVRPRWSRDGRTIVAGSRSGLVFALDADGSHVRLLGAGNEPDALSSDGPLLYNLPTGTMVADGLGLDGAPWMAGGAFFHYATWSPDGGRIAHTCPSSGEQLCVSTRSGGPVSIATMGGTVAFPDWSADGREIVFWSAGGVYVVPADGSSPPSRVRLPAELEGPTWVVAMPRWTR